MFFRDFEEYNQNIFQTDRILKTHPDLNVLERVLIAVKFLSKNIEKQKSYPRFSKLNLFLSSQLLYLPRGR